MNQFPWGLFILLCCLISCQQKKSQSDTAKQSATGYPEAFKIRLTGTIALPDSTKIYVNTDENTLQPLLSAYVKQGKFALEGELTEPNFYNLVIQKKNFKVYLENGADYTFKGEVGSAGRITHGEVTSSSKIMNDYVRFQKLFEQRHGALYAQSRALVDALNNPKTYRDAVGKSLALDEQKKRLKETIQDEFLDDGDVHPGMKLFIIKEDRIGQQNYKRYDHVLQRVPDTLKNTVLYKQAKQKVDAVKSFYDNMPNFPDIYPRNPAGDSLKLDRFKAEGTWLVVFWGSWNKESKADIRMIKRKAAALASMGVRPIYLTWDKDFDAWKAASDELNLGQDNYRLNAQDQEFVVNHYGVRAMPHYLLVDASDRTIINPDFRYPLHGRLESSIEKELNKK
ncbi:DUF4369 domain-containing protein [Sphingobacterium suaedae]|uniref:DUF4369 domain-containing protein n=1 Tax=Sphingobacterium suaedae TaxID=1686402 RepID=A0ABW5KQG4_9SPHI